MDKRKMVQVEVDSKLATKVAGIRFQTREQGSPTAFEYGLENEVMVCLCERVSKKQIAELVQMGVRDLNAIKAATRCGMGACNGKTCESLVKQVFQEQGIPLDSVTGYVKRPFAMEVPLTALFRDGRK
jgi:NAD(P)H-nitrite reductase large subunit